MITQRQSQSASADDPELSLWRLLRSLLDHWKVGAAVFTLSVLVGMGAYFLLPRVYEASALLAPAKDVSSGGGLASLAGKFGGIASLAGVELPDQQSEAEIALALLESEGFLRDFIARENAFPLLFPPEETKSKPEDLPSMHDAYLKFRDDVVEVSKGRPAGLIEVRVKWTDPALAVAWCTGLVDQLNAAMRSKAAEEAQKSLEFLNRELGKTAEMEVRASIYGLIETQVNQLMFANVREDFIFRVIDSPHLSREDEFVSPNKIVLGAATVVFSAVLALLAMAFARAFDASR